jgi:hypothetical protein
VLLEIQGLLSPQGTRPMRLSNDESEKWHCDAHKRGLTPFAFDDQAGGAVGRKPIVQTDAKVWNHSALESRVELHSIVI